MIERVTGVGGGAVGVWPWGHLAVGYLLYAGYLRFRFQEQPRGWPVVALALGTQFPDVVDKPLAYWFAVLPEGRSLAHSVFSLVVVCLVVVWVAQRIRRSEIGVAFAIGFASHLLADSYTAVLASRFDELTFLLWPVVASPDYDASDFTYHLQELLAALTEVDAYRLVTGWADPFVFQLWLVIFTMFLWAYHRAPPFPTWRTWWASR